jgi:hypothetical protein
MAARTTHFHERRGVCRRIGRVSVPQMIKPLFFGLLLLSGTVGAQSKIAQSKKELSSDQAAPKQNEQKNTETSEADPFWTETVFNFTIGPVIWLTVGDYGSEYHLSHYLTPYPLYNGESGNYEGYDTIQKKKIRLDLSDKFLYSGNNLYGNHFKANFRPTYIFSLEADYFQLFESNLLNNTHEQLSLFYLSFCYDRLRFEKFNVGWNIGASYVASGVNKAGFAIGLSADYFVGKHLSLSASAKSSLVNHQPVNAFDVNGKFYRKNYYLSLGYQRLKIGSPSYNFVAVGGGISF